MLHSDCERPALPRVPVIDLAQAGPAAFFDDAGCPMSAGWDTIDFPNLGDTTAYALKNCGDSMEPVYREGDILIVSPNAAFSPASG